jgi:VWFA-related protein
VPVVVRDKQGHAIGGLAKDDFQVFDRGKPQVVTGLTVQKRTETENSSNGGAATPAAPGAPPASVVLPNRFIVFLFDDLHLAADNLMQVQKAANELFGEALAPTDLAAVVSFSGANTGLTQDRAKLQEGVAKLHTRGLYQQVESDCPNVNYYQADLIENKHNNSALQAAIESALLCANLDRNKRDVAETMVETASLRALSVGDQDVRVTLSGVADFVRRMGTLPGQRVLILISPGFLTMTQEAMTDKSRIMDIAAQANVTVNALDARGLYTTEIDATQRGADSARALMTGSMSEYHRESTIQKDDVMAELADGTGGTFFHNSNDLVAGFKSLSMAPEYLYLLEFSPKDVKQNGSYHSLDVKVDRDGVRVQARRGYFAEKVRKGKK